MNYKKNRRDCEMTQPAYWKLESKIKARSENVETYQKLTGRSSLPIDRGYWTLCNYQPPQEEGTEIVQLERLGFVKKSQFFGVDWDENIIEQNKEWHPEAHWYHGEWIKVIREQDNFNPALIYLDVTKFADRIGAANMVASTMHLCPIDTVLLVNVMLSDPRSSVKFDAAMLVQRIVKSVGTFELKKWAAKVDNFEYNATRKTNMITYVFYKKA